MVEEVLPHCPWRQIVFTIPKILRKSFLFDRTLYGELCRVAYASTKDFLQAHFPGLENPVPAMVVAPQSWGSLLNHHPHTHSLCSEGVFDQEGRFHSAEGIDFSPLEEIFREKMLKMMLKKEVITEERVELLRSWKHSGFNIDSTRRIDAGDRKSLESLLEYFERPAGF